MLRTSTLCRAGETEEVVGDCIPISLAVYQQGAHKQKGGMVVAIKTVSQKMMK